MALYFAVPIAVLMVLTLCCCLVLMVSLFVFDDPSDEFAQLLLLVMAGLMALVGIFLLVYSLTQLI